MKKVINKIMKINFKTIVTYWRLDVNNFLVIFYIFLIFKALILASNTVNLQKIVIFLNLIVFINQLIYL